MEHPAADQPESVHTPAEQVPITFFDVPCLAVRDTHGPIYLSIRDMCTALDVDLSSQSRRIRTHEQLSQGLARFRVATGGGDQVYTFLHLQMVSAWLLMMNTARVKPETRQRLVHLQQYLVNEVYAAFARLAGLPEDAAAIEDLEQLRQIDEALELLSGRQHDLEVSQDQARHVWREVQDQMKMLSTRMHALEQRVGSTITKAQRGHIYQLVEHWAQARATHDQRQGASRKTYYASCWTTIKAKYQLARYEDLPAAQYADCVAFIQQHYQQLTGTPLNLPAQNEMDLE